MTWLESLTSLIRDGIKRNSLFRRLLWTAVFTLILWLVLSSSLIPQRYDLEVGQLSHQDIHAPRTVVDRLETDRLRQMAADEVQDVYEQDPRVVEEVSSDVQALFAAVREIKRPADPESELAPVIVDDDPVQEDADEEDAAEPESIDESEVLAGQHEELARIQGLEDLSENERNILLHSSIEELVRLEQLTLTVLRRVMEGGIKEDSLPAFRRQVEAELEAVEIKPGLKVIASHVAQALLRPNMVLNAELTLERKRRAMEAVEPVRVLEGDLIIGEGERVNEWHLSILRELGLERSQGNWQSLLGAGLLSLVLVLLVALYLSQFEQHIVAQESFVILTGLIGILTVVLVEVLKPISGYLPPVATGTMLLAILVSPRVAMFVGALLALIVGMLTGNDIRFLLVALVGGSVGVYSVVRIGQRSDLAKTGLVVALANVSAVAVIAMLWGNSSIYQLALWKDLGWAAAGGLFAAVLTIGSLPFFENYFGIITSVKLLEMANPNQPLLRRLLVETPGTYHHSVMVANLAESGVEAIGGDSLLARVGSYYHDIGKLKRPYFFIENQLAGDNPHDKISPSLSVLILTSHVRDGVELARQEHLPETVISFVREHHGTSLVSYFYNRASENGQDEVAERDFRYEGPRPQSRETAVVMLADSCEAAVRSLSRPTPSRIETMVRKIIRDRLNDHQLDRCDLTLRELDLLADTFVRVLTGVFHPRIEYPDMIKDIWRREGSDEAEGSHDSEPSPPGPSREAKDNNQQSPEPGEV